MLTDNFYLMLANLVKASVEGNSLYLAVGSGQAAWDKIPPVPVRGVQRLEKELFRKQVEAAGIRYLDGENRESASPLPRLGFRVTLSLAEAAGTLRECGLFAGAAGPAPDSGTLISYVTHTRLTKTSGMELRRSIHLDLTPHPPLAVGTPAGRYLANTHSREFHDLENIKPRCRIQLIRIDHRQSLPSVELALSLGYDYCGFCFPPGFSQR